MKKTGLTLSLSILVGVFGSNHSLGQSSELGRFFSTPAERAQLDRLRAEMIAGMTEIQIPQPDALGDETVSELPPDLFLYLAGSVSRRDGYVTLWLNGAAVDQRDLPEGYEVVRQGPVTMLQIKSGKDVYLIRPGQELNLRARSISNRPFLQAELNTQNTPARAADGTESAAAPVSAESPLAIINTMRVLRENLP
ncbi:MAG: hypothetical protein Q7W55_08400 [Pseudohongiella sp.]|nr:hypothetical protein [Pseudohongiella sp.]